MNGLLHYSPVLVCFAVVFCFFGVAPYMVGNTKCTVREEPINNFNDCIFFASQDEIFHIPQAQEYCIGNFHSWDPKITTFPGLYLITAGAKRVVEAFTFFDVVCSTDFLRLFNATLSVAIFGLARTCRRMVSRYRQKSMGCCL